MFGKCWTSFLRESLHAGPHQVTEGEGNSRRDEDERAIETENAVATLWRARESGRRSRGRCCSAQTLLARRGCRKKSMQQNIKIKEPRARRSPVGREVFPSPRSPRGGRRGKGGTTNTRWPLAGTPLHLDLVGLHHFDQPLHSLPECRLLL